MDNINNYRNIDPTERSSVRGDAQVTHMAREQETDDMNDNSSLGNVTTPKGDSAAENKVATSLDDE